MSTWRCKRCSLIYRDGEQKPICDRSPCPMALIDCAARPSIIRKLVALILMVLLLGPAALIFTASQILDYWVDLCDDAYDWLSKFAGIK